MITTINKICIEVSNRLLRGELAAIETYQNILAKYPGSLATPELMRIQAEHRRSARSLTEEIQGLGATPDTESGVSNRLSEAVNVTTSLNGSNSAVEFLTRGEKHLRREYQKALDNEDVMDSRKAMIRNELLPRVKRQIRTLDRLDDAIE